MVVCLLLASKHFRWAGCCVHTCLYLNPVCARQCLIVSQTLVITCHLICLSVCLHVYCYCCVCVCVPLLVMVTLLCEPKCVYGQLKWLLYCYGCFVFLYCVYKTNNCAQCDIIFKSNYTEQRRAGERRDGGMHRYTLCLYYAIVVL